MDDEVRRAYDAYAPRYDRETGWYERVMLGDGRAWACSQARGVTLEVGVGTGRNLEHYPSSVRLIGLDLSTGMLARARARLPHPSSALVAGDAHHLPLRPGSVDTVVCTLTLSSVPDLHLTLREIRRVLDHGGRLVSLGHVASPHRPVLALQRALDRVAATRAPDEQARDTTAALRTADFEVLYRRTTRWGIIERLTAAPL
ncbi:class I SAM-dependent methyltransferase [Nocardiopsis sp. HNM0947]|uniref:Class I SAM-dependent methyltransferase n=1 Tax=Nocardiopsis coralli TaxID=2772213 RepID=A0ABR9P401_9ACTN|nr:class I SAM-dependent methyltransferase [Nocardiopsis coralli]MBE2998530.1 class I SAM-dependent methyltransferase [Nocardiopsis coralli]